MSKGRTGARPRGPGFAGRAAPPRGSAERDPSYLWQSTRPLHILVFLLPLILFYEASAAFHLIGTDLVEETIRARRILGDVFRIFNVGGVYLPGILVAVVLLLWHIQVKDPWRVRGRVLGIMALEALAWTPPALVLGQVLYKLMSGSLGAHPPTAGVLELFSGAAVLAADPSTPDALQRPLMARAAIAVGAGLYEEMLFRMVAIAVFHVIFVDLIGMAARRGAIASVFAAAVAFALYHDVGAIGTVRWADAGFYLFAGLYFGLIYVWRGFGVVVGVHALYDLAVLVFLRQH